MYNCKWLFILLPVWVLSFFSAKGASVTASFSVSPSTKKCQDSSFTFKSTSTYVGGSTDSIKSYTWYFGDGTTSTLKYPAPKTYSSSGTFTVSLVVKTTDNLKDSTSKIITVYPLPVVKFGIIHADCQRVEMQFIDTVTVATGSKIVTWVYDYGDGKKDSVNFHLDPTHTFTTAGTYIVRHTVYTDKGCKGSLIKTLNVKPSVKAFFSFIPVCLDSSIDLDATGSTVPSGVTATYKWFFPDTTQATGLKVTKTFKSSGPQSVMLVVLGSNGCNDTLRKTVTIYDKPTVLVSFKNTCEDSALTIVNKSFSIYGTIKKFSWDFGDGTTKIDTVRIDTFTHAYAKAGTYTVSLSLQSTKGCVTNWNKSVTMNTLPKADFSFNKTCEDTAMIFTDKTQPGSGTNKYWLWYFGDSLNGVPQTSTLQNPAHKYAKSGKFKVKLIATNSNGCIDSSLQTVTIHTRPKANYFFATNCKDSTIAFTDVSSVAETGATVNKWNWDFGDGGTSIAQNPKHVFTKEGTYNVRLVVTSSWGCRDTNIQNVEIFPVPKVNYSYSGTCERDSIRFTDLTTLASGTVAKYVWDFGDGNFAYDKNVSNFFYGPGDFKVTLTVTSDKGCPASYSKIITIVPGPVAKFTVGTSCEASAVNFTNTSTITGGPTITGYKWNFGDGSAPVFTKDASHVFPKAGAYNVLMTVTSSNGCKDSTSTPVLVTSLPVPDFSFKNTCNDSAVTFTDNSTVSGTSIKDRLWYFSDGGTASGAKVSHKFSTPGKYNIKLVVRTPAGCADSITKVVQTYPKPKANFTSITHCGDSAIEFQDLSTMPNGDTVVAWAWSFADGVGTSTLKDPTFVFGKGGYYNVRLSVFSRYGCMDTVTKKVLVYPLPKVQFAQIPYGCEKTPIQFTDQTYMDPTGTTVVKSYLWNFGDSSTSNQKNPTHVFKNPGTYNVKLYVSSTRGCRDSFDRDIIIRPLPKPDFVFENTCVNDIFGVHFTDSTAPVDVYEYSWDFGDGQKAKTFDLEIEHKYNDTGTYYVKFTPKNSKTQCEATITKMVRIHPTPVMLAKSDTVCFGQATSFINNTFVPGGSVVSYEWDLGDGTMDTVPAPVHIYKKAQTYDAKLTVTSSFGCTDTLHVPVIIKPAPKASFTITPFPVDFLNTNVTFTNTSQGAVSYRWDLGDGHRVLTKDAANTYPEDTGIYPVTLVAYNDLGCTDTMVFILNIGQGFKITAPNAVSPNGDHTNDVWKPVGVGIKMDDYELIIINAWGQEVFRSNDFNEAWKGDYQRTGNLVPEGVYFYQIRTGDFSNEETHVLKGNITVIR